MAPKKNVVKKDVAAKSQPQKPDDDYIVFGHGPASNKKGNQGEGPPAAPRPDTRKIIGGQSWTGKLPVNLLSEHCQREKWNKPEYSMRQVPGQGSERKHRSHVTLSKTDSKTRETTTVPPFDLPASHLHLADQPTALEARHFAATYALFRVASMKNIHMMLPPTYRDLWKGPFQELKKEDVKEQRGWKYDADPFAADTKRKEIQASIQKRKVEQEKKQAEQVTTNTILPVIRGEDARKWARAPRVELGENLRNQLEAVVRSHTIWNIHQSQLSSAESAAIVKELSDKGFRASHVLEATGCCGSRQEVLDWLLIHVPEDDLPPWALMAGYKAGVSLASGDVTKDAKLRRLSKAGYSADVCAQALRENDGDEAAALEALQAALVPPALLENSSLEDSDRDLWQAEMVAVAAVYADRYTTSGPNACLVNLDLPSVGPVTVFLQMPISNYPFRAVPIISIDAQDHVPAYIRLSATKKAARYAWDSLLGEQMVFALVDWIESSLPGIIENPGRLVDVEVSTPTFKLNQILVDEPPNKMSHSRNQRQPERHPWKDVRTNEQIRQAWNARQATAAQQKMLAIRESLPAWKMASEIVDRIHHSQVTIITGDTGSGKSTQSVQFVLDYAISQRKGTNVNILCTQPRRVAALALSDRVAAERCSVEGDEVGYIIRGESKVSSRTKITFMTTGVLLRRLQLSVSPKVALQGISHVFVDEVHERSLDTDFLLALLKDALPHIPSLKVVCMSATLDADVFTRYFGGPNKVGRAHIEGRTFPVLDFFLDDVLSMTGSATANREDGEEGIGKAIQKLGIGINYELIARLVQDIDHQLSTATGGILIFLPGTMEIERCLRSLSNIPGLHALPLHASLMPFEQKQVFPPSPKGLRKVIVATNVAETSITIEDIVAVIDTGRVKETSYGIESKIVRLEEVWTSQASCRQRRGRAGRVKEGTCYKLFTRNIEASMRPQSEPEMRRVPLEQLCLSVKASSPQSDVAHFLSKVLSPPDSRAVTTALHMLHRMGALENNYLTGLGSSMAMIPADLRCAKLLIYGSLFGCLESCLTIAAILSVKSPFVSPRDKREEANGARASFPVENGDLIVDLCAFNEWKLHHRDDRRWCEGHFLSSQILRDIDSTRQQLLDSLKEAAFVPTNYRYQYCQSSNINTKQSATTNSYHEFNAHSSNNALLRALIAGALSPQIVEIKLPEKKYIASMSGAKELDPEARTIKYFAEPTTSLSSTLQETHDTESGGSGTSTRSSTPTQSQSQPQPHPHTPASNRVFIHPSSALFSHSATTTSSSTTYLSYFTKLATTKSFIHTLTPLNAYYLLLFGGTLEIDPQGGGMVVDNWLRLRGWARIGVLVGRLRGVVDDVLRRKIEGVGQGDGEDEGEGEGESKESSKEKRVRREKEEKKILALVRKLVEMNGQDR